MGNDSMGVDCTIGASFYTSTSFHPSLIWLFSYTASAFLSAHVIAKCTLPGPPVYLTSLHCGSLSVCVWSDTPWCVCFTPLASKIKHTHTYKYKCITLHTHTPNCTISVFSLCNTHTHTSTNVSIYTHTHQTASFLSSLSVTHTHTYLDH